MSRSNVMSNVVRKLHVLVDTLGNLDYTVPERDREFAENISEQVGQHGASKAPATPLVREGVYRHCPVSEVQMLNLIINCRRCSTTSAFSSWSMP